MCLCMQKKKIRANFQHKKKHSFIVKLDRFSWLISNKTKINIYILFAFYKMFKTHTKMSLLWGTMIQYLHVHLHKFYGHSKLRCSKDLSCTSTHFFLQDYHNVPFKSQHIQNVGWSVIWTLRLSAVSVKITDQPTKSLCTRFLPIQYVHRKQKKYKKIT